MASKPSASRLREVKIELLRARAAIERQTLQNSLRHVGQDLQPGALLRSFLPASVSRKRPTDWLFQGLGLLRRYPFIVSTASTLLSGVRKRNRLLRLGAGLLLSWQVARNMGGRDDRGGTGASR
ncbi:hypothetical protein [Pusillimonas noertemannii]|uniref:YqjK-like protein n=1 Tax=Pusillimonas noertemannii TaxID=305977 RepID=A0A2U1CR81_9BURK|nr:hypothetical protein [Pusillimonas noertemannii]NYT67736.1 hypothetical protein [Pusillimonas noertemannii]PVY68407.1 hypothetical protein C7440_0807 [Pusillimonas noertemannii]TFL12111.1 hypothetical protein CSC72_03015 [Pusillimonas noertemannii]